MADVTITIARNGQSMEVDVSGEKGKSCKKIMEVFTRIGKVKSEEKKSEYHMEGRKDPELNSEFVE